MRRPGPPHTPGGGPTFGPRLPAPQVAGAQALLQVPVGRGDHAHVHADRGIASQAPDRAALEDAQALRLQVQWHFANLVQEDRAAAGLLEHAGAPARGSREPPASCPKSSLEIRPGSMAPQSSTMNGPFLRALASRKAAATSSLPVPEGPVTRVVVPYGLTDGWLTPGSAGRWFEPTQPVAITCSASGPLGLYPRAFVSITHPPWPGRLTRFTELTTPSTGGLDHMIKTRCAILEHRGAIIIPSGSR